VRPRHPYIDPRRGRQNTDRGAERRQFADADRTRGRKTPVVCGEVTIAEGCRVLFGAVLSADGGPIGLGAGCLVMENAVRPSSHHAELFGSHRGDTILPQ